MTPHMSQTFFDGSAAWKIYPGGKWKGYTMKRSWIRMRCTAVCGRSEQVYPGVFQGEHYASA